MPRKKCKNNCIEVKKLVYDPSKKKKQFTRTYYIKLKNISKSTAKRYINYLHFDEKLITSTLEPSLRGYINEYAYKSIKGMKDVNKENNYLIDAVDAVDKVAVSLKDYSVSNTNMNKISRSIMALYNFYKDKGKRKKYKNFIKELAKSDSKEFKNRILDLLGIRDIDDVNGFRVIKRTSNLSKIDFSDDKSKLLNKLEILDAAVIDKEGKISNNLKGFILNSKIKIDKDKIYLTNDNYKGIITIKVDNDGSVKLDYSAGRNNNQSFTFSKKGDSVNFKSSFKEEISSEIPISQVKEHIKNIISSTYAVTGSKLLEEILKKQSDKKFNTLITALFYSNSYNIKKILSNSKINFNENDILNLINFENIDDLIDAGIKNDFNLNKPLSNLERIKTIIDSEVSYIKNYIIFKSVLNIKNDNYVTSDKIKFIDNYIKLTTDLLKNEKIKSGPAKGEIAEQYIESKIKRALLKFDESLDLPDLDRVIRKTPAGKKGVDLLLDNNLLKNIIKGKEDKFFKILKEELGGDMVQTIKENLASDNDISYIQVKSTKAKEYQFYKRVKQEDNKNIDRELIKKFNGDYVNLPQSVKEKIIGLYKGYKVLNQILSTKDIDIGDIESINNITEFSTIVDEFINNGFKDIDVFTLNINDFSLKKLNIESVNLENIKVNNTSIILGNIKIYYNKTSGQARVIYN